MGKDKLYYLIPNEQKNNESNDIFHNLYYFDNNSTTLIYNKDVKDAIIKWISCGNPSNILHDFGLMAHNKIEECRHIIARDLCPENEAASIYNSLG